MRKGQTVILKKLDIVAELHKVKGGAGTASGDTGTVGTGTVGTGVIRGGGGPVCW